MVQVVQTAHAAPKADLWPIWDASGSETGIQHEQWQQVLTAYVRPDEEGLNRVDYQAIRETGQDQLESYLNYAARIDPRTYTRDEQMAYWINVYNALTIQVVLRYPNKGSIVRMGEKLFAIGPWDDAVFTVAGESLTLNDIEHRILRPIWRDHRIHYAVNCASVGCPNLSTQAYSAASLEEQLASAEKTYLTHPRGLLIEGNKAKLSSIFKWYRSDFGEEESDVLTYMSEFSAPLKDLLEQGRRVRTSYDYDWSLNEAK